MEQKKNKRNSFVFGKAFQTGSNYHFIGTLSKTKAKGSWKRKESFM